MRLMMLGASQGQLLGIMKAKDMGHEVITCDYIQKAVGHAFADEQIYLDTFDAQGVLLAARKLNLDGVMTMGTDQPVYTAATVAEALQLPMLISKDTALRVTNKVEMKKTFEAYGLPHVSSILYEIGVNDADLDQIEYPVVVKPVDSQGQRGVYYLESSTAVKMHYQQVIKFSRQKHILVETYYAHDEVTVSGWVHNGLVTILAVTDRVTFLDKDRIGICLSHEYPSKHLKRHGNEIYRLTDQLVEAFNVTDGPIYFQHFIGEKGIRVNEVACRIGGAYEAVFLPLVSGFDICKAAIEGALGIAYSAERYRVNPCEDRVKALSVQLFFCEPGLITSMPDLEDVKSLEGVIDAGFNKKKGDLLGPIQNATARVGYVIVVGEDGAQVEDRLKKLYSVLRLENENGVNGILHRPI